MEGRHQQNNRGGYSGYDSRNTRAREQSYRDRDQYYREAAGGRRPAAEDIQEEDWRMERRRRSGWAAPVIIILVLLLVILVGLTVITKNVSNSDRIFPNISVNGVDLGGLTLAQAEEKLLQSDTAEVLNKTVTVNLPDGSSVTVTAEEAGVTGDITEAAQMAYMYGRTGNTAGDMLRIYLYSLGHEQNMTWTVSAQADEEGIRQVVEPAVQEANTALLEVNASIGDEEITLVKSTGSGGGVDADEVVSQVAEAFDTQNYSDITAGVDGTDDDASTYAILESLYDGVYQEPVDASYDSSTGDIEKGEQGVSFDLEEAKQLWDEAEVGDTIVIPLIFTDPEITAEDLSEATFDDLLSEKSTTLAGSSSNRITNITLAAEALDGVVLLPGETFNYNNCLGERTAEKGYKEAGAYAGGQHVTAIGGGICQASSTLYYCALYANLKITVRDNHYFTVSYLPLGLDATVSWGGPDFCFVNSRNYPIRINAWVEDGNLTVQIWGTDEDGSYVEITSDEWEDSQFYYAQTYRTVYAADGTVISTGEEAYSRYYKSGSSSTYTGTDTSSGTSDSTSTATDTPAQTETPVVTEPPAVTAAPVVTEPPSDPVIPEPPVVTEPPAPVDPGTDTAEGTGR